MFTLRAPGRGLNHLLFSPDGTALAAAGNGWGVSVWSLHTGGPPGRYLDRCRGILALAFSLDGQRLYTCCKHNRYRASWPTSLFAVDRGTRAINTFSQFGATGFVRAGETDQLFAVGWRYQQDKRRHDYSVAGLRSDDWRPEIDSDFANAFQMMWEVDQGAHPLGGPVRAAPDGRVAYCTAGKDQLAVFDTATGHMVSTVVLPTKTSANLAVSPDGGRLAWTSRNAVYVRDLSTGETSVCRADTPHHLNDVTFHPSGRWMVTAGGDGAVRFWNATNWSPGQVFHWRAGRMTCVAFSPDGLLAAAGGASGQVVVWDVDL